MKIQIGSISEIELILLTGRKGVWLTILFESADYESQDKNLTFR